MTPANFDFWLANLNFGASSAGTFDAFVELESDSAPVGIVNGVHDVDRETILVKHECHPNVLDLEGGRFERAGRDDDVALLFENSLRPGDCLLGKTGKTGSA